MIIGVDEAGDFSAGTRGFYVAAFVRPSEHAEIAIAHREWERKVRHDLGLRGELKGSTVTEPWALSLVHDVLRATPFGVRYRAFAVDGTPANLAAMEAQRRILFTGYQNYAQDVADDFDPKVRRRATVWQSQAEWVAALTPPRLLRLATMMTILPEILELAFDYSLAGRFDEELEHLRVDIDRGYVQSSELVRWRELLRNVFIDQSRHFPLPIGEHWTEDHPFVRKYVDERSSTGLLLRQNFSRVFGFARSEQTPIVRLADVIVSIVRRFELNGDFGAVQAALSRHHLREERLAVLTWNDTTDPRERNPYLDFPNR